MSTQKLLDVQNLSVCFGDAPPAVDSLTFQIAPGEILALVGESGSGKSVAMLALMGLAGDNAHVSADRMTFNDLDLMTLNHRQRRQLLGRELGMVFQDPMTALNPSFTVGFQIQEVLKRHLGLRGKALRQHTLALLEKVDIPAPESRMKAYPHQLSGGMNQRVAIAMAIAANPKLLIADEPTTALDVTIQAQIMQLLLTLQREQNMALILISHDLAVVAQTARRIGVLYAGQLMETGDNPDLLRNPAHPYTEALLRAIPERSHSRDRLPSLPGRVPGRDDRPAGCLLSPRCPYAQARCAQSRPGPLLHGRRIVRCFYPLSIAEDCT